MNARKFALSIGLVGALLVVVSLTPLLQNSPELPLSYSIMSSKPMARGFKDGMQFETYEGGAIIHLKYFPALTFALGMGLVFSSVATMIISRTRKPSA